jgi:glucosamine--fructose-6-phosphate aminotransferase (isomerizing)
MCGIFGYVGMEGAGKKIVNGLKRLEYRGYDSWGVALLNEGEINVTKKVGAIGDLDDLDLPQSHIGVGHTRWATHGGVTEVNAHPHYSTDKSFILAQNGIVENFQVLKADLESKGYEFVSETDTEVIVRLVEEKLKHTSDIRQAVREAFLDLEGRNTIILLSRNDDRVIAIRNGSPLVVGVGDSEYFFASDTLSFADRTGKAIFMDDFQMVEYYEEQVELFDVKTGEKIDWEVKPIDHVDINIDKSGYDHFMLKEIIEQKDAIRNAVQYSIHQLQPLLKAIKNAGTVFTVGAGTASFEAGQAAYFFRSIAGKKAIELKSYEMQSYRDLFRPDDLLIAFSQSGETADTIEAVEIAKSNKVKIASIVNMRGSTITRLSDFPFFVRSGPEICVCSTKAFSATLAWALLVAHSFKDKYESIRSDVYTLSDALQEYFTEDLFEDVKALVEKLKDCDHAFVLGRGRNYYVALEAALKIKEISYLHAEGFAAGELKHGVIALIEEGTPVFTIVGNDERSDILSAAAEVKARGAWTIGIGQEANELFDDFLKTPCGGEASCIGNIIPFQLIAYFLALKLKYDPDKPRNLAKSVTVK